MSASDGLVALDSVTVDATLLDVSSADVARSDDAARGDSASVDAGAFDTGGPDAGAFDTGGPDAGDRTNPDVELIREITFEQPDGTNGWTDSASVVFNWQRAAIGRDRVPDAMVRMAGGINIADVVSDITYRGARAARFTMQDWGRSSFRTDLEIVGDVSADPRIPRRLPSGETHVVGFAMRIEHPTLDAGWQLYHQYHGASAVPRGYGSANNPAVALHRSGDNDMSVVIRSNGPGGARPETSMHMPGMASPGTWVRWVFKTRFEDVDSDRPGLVEVHAAQGDEPLTLQFRVDDVPVGYVYASESGGEAIIFDCYGRPLQEDAEVFLDEVRIATGDVDPSVVDPIRWVSYQHPLNQPYDADLAR